MLLKDSEVGSKATARKKKKMEMVFVHIYICTIRYVHYF